MATKKSVKGIVTETRATADARSGEVMCARQTLGTTAQVCSVAIPSWARKVKLYPNTTALVYAIDEDPVAITAVGYTASVTATSAYGIGGQAIPSLWTEIMLDDGSGGSTRPTTIRMRPATNSSTVDIVFLG